jgi:alanine dehydrogenase
MSSAVDIENIVNITKHSNNYKNTIYTDNEYKIVSNELISNIESLRTSEDVIKFQKNIQRKYKISLSKANLIYFYKSLNLDNNNLKNLITKKKSNLSELYIIALCFCDYI